MDSSEFFGDEPVERNPRQTTKNGRYLLDADGTGQKSYTRATTLAKTLDEGRGLAVWQQRKAAKGVAVSPALTARAKVTPLDDGRVWREILDQADVKTEGDEKREWGSAFHEFHERVPGMTDDEYAAQAIELRVTYERYRAELDRLGITEVMTEGTCVNTAIGTAGKFDAIFRLADGRLVIGDRKTGRVVEYPHSPAVQFAIYANADVLIEFDKNGAQHRVPMPNVDKTIALVVDITIGDETTAAVHVYEVDIWAGWYGALLAGQVRRWRNRKDLIRPFHPEFPPAERALSAAAVEPVKVIQSATLDAVTPHGFALSNVATGQSDSETFTNSQNTGDPYVQGPPLPPNQAWFEQQTPGHAQPVEQADRPGANVANTERLGGPMQQPAHAAHPITKQAWSSAEQRNITLNPDGTRTDGLTGPEVTKVLAGPQPLASPGTVGDVNALLRQFKTKAELQTAAKRLDPSIEVTRTRKNLAGDMVAHPQWAARRSEFLPGDPVARVQEASDEAAAVYGGVSPETPLPGREAPESFSPVVTNAPGPVPLDPTPAFPVVEHGPAIADLAPDPSLNPFRQPVISEVPVPVKTKEDELVERIAATTTVAQIGDLWDEANKAGLGWPPRLHQAATIRTKQLEQEGK